MSETTPPAEAGSAALDSDLEDFAQQIADQVQSFLLALQAIARGDTTGGQAISLLLLEVSQVLLAGARLGVQRDFEPVEKYEPDAGPDPDLDEMRLRLAVLLEPVDAFTEIFDPYVDPPELTPSLLSDDLTSMATALAHGLRHYKAGRVDEALWWWQFSYLSSWGARAASALRVIQSILSHLRLDADEETVADAEFDALHP